MCENCSAAFIPARLAQPAHPLTDIRCLGVLNEALQKSIHALKYDSITGLATPLGKLMATAIIEAQWTQGLIIPVPLHKMRYQERGYNQAALLSQVIADQLGWQQNTESLARFRDTPSQVGLNAQERRQNMVDAFTVNDPEDIRDHDIILIDDVYTTGATLRECAKALFKVGVRTVRAVVAAQASQSTPT